MVILPIFIDIGYVNFLKNPHNYVYIYYLAYQLMSFGFYHFVHFLGFIHFT